MAIYDRLLDKSLQRLGYQKAITRGAQPITTIFAGEAPVGSGIDYTKFSDEQWEKIATNSAWVSSDINEISSLAIASDFGVFRRDGENLLPEYNHPFEQLMRRPNPYMAGDFIMLYTFWWWLLRGEAYWWKIFDNAGELVQLWPIPASRMEPIPDPQKYIAGYAYKPRDGKPAKIIPTSQVCFFRFPNPFDFHRGMSRLSAARLGLATDLAAAIWNRETFTNDVALRTLISIPAELSQPLKEQAKAEILQELVEEKKRFMIAGAGDVKAQVLSITHKDLEFLAGRDFTKKEIDRIFGFREGYWSEKANRANGDSAKASLIEAMVWPLLKLMHGEISAQIIVPHYGEEYRGRFEDIRIHDRELEAKEAEMYWPSYALNETRQERKLDPLPKVIIEVGDEELSLWDDIPTGQIEKFIPFIEGSKNETPPQLKPFTGETIQLGEEIDEGEPDEDETAADEMAEIAKAHLKKWEGVCRRRLKNDEPALYDFESKFIAPNIHADIMTALKSATTDEEVKAAFAAPFCWEGYP